MINVVPLKYGPAFKNIFRQPAIFSRFASDVLGIPINIDTVHTEYEYPEPIGFVRSKYDLFGEDTEKRIIVEIQNVKEDDFFDRFLYYHLISLAEQAKRFTEYCFDLTVYTIVVLASVPKDKTINFSYAVSNFSPINEYGERVEVYPHRLVFLVPRLVNDRTPAVIRAWLEFIGDSFDGSMDETNYQEQFFQGILEKMRRTQLTPEELAVIKDEAAWEKAKAQSAAKGRAKGRAEGRVEGEANALLRLLERRFHTIPEDIRPKIQKADLSTLEIWFERAFDAQTLEMVFN